MSKGINIEVANPLEEPLSMRVTVQTGQDLFNQVASQLMLRATERRYFGLSFIDKDGFEDAWFTSDKKVVEHDLGKPTASGVIPVVFRVKFYPFDAIYLQDDVSIKLFFKQASCDIIKEALACPVEVALELAPYFLQAHFGNYSEEVHGPGFLTRNKMEFLPSSVYSKHPSLNALEEKIMPSYKNLLELPKKQACIDYLLICQTLPMYSIHFYNLKDDNKHPVWLGIGPQSIGIYDYNDRVNPRHSYEWSSLKNLSYKEKKLKIEIKTADDNEEKRYFYTRNYRTSKAILAMVRSSHGFYVSEAKNYARQQQQQGRYKLAPHLLIQVNSLSSLKSAQSFSDSNNVSSESCDLTDGVSVESLEEFRDEVWRTQMATIEAEKFQEWQNCCNLLHSLESKLTEREEELRYLDEQLVAAMAHNLHETIIDSDSDSDNDIDESLGCTTSELHTPDGILSSQHSESSLSQFETPVDSADTSMKMSASVTQDSASSDISIASENLSDKENELFNSPPNNAVLNLVKISLKESGNNVVQNSETYSGKEQLPDDDASDDELFI